MTGSPPVDEVDEASIESFPASDPPPFWARDAEPTRPLGREQTAADSDDLARHRDNFRGETGGAALDQAPADPEPQPELAEIHGRLTAPEAAGDLAPLVADWPVHRRSVGVTSPDRSLGVGGDPGWQSPIASVGKLLVGVAALVAVEEGTIDLDEPAGPVGSTVRHLLAHASGLAFDEDRVIAPVGRRRIYSNAGIERFAGHLEERAGMPFGEYLGLGVLEPLGMSRTELRGSPARDAWSTTEDLLAFTRELLRPTLVSAATVAEATRPQFPEIAGVLPDIGRFEPNPWGLTFEIRDGKDPHWTGHLNSPRTFGHFGGSGSFLWVDPDADLAAVALTDREFGPWALEAWPRFSDAVLQRYGTR